MKKYNELLYRLDYIDNLLSILYEYKSSLYYKRDVYSLQKILNKLNNKIYKLNKEKAFLEEELELLSYKIKEKV